MMNFRPAKNCEPYWKLTAIWRSLLNVNMERQYLIIFQTILLTLFFRY